MRKEEQQFIKTLRNEFQKQGKSYNGMGDELKISPNSVKRTLLGLNSPTLSILIKICYSLGFRLTLVKKK